MSKTYASWDGNAIAASAGMCPVDNCYSRPDWVVMPNNFRVCDSHVSRFASHQIGKPKEQR